MNTLRIGNRTTAASDVARPFDRDASRDLEAFEVASNNLREAWRALTVPARRNARACGVILEIAAMLGDLASERRRIEEEVGV